MNNELILELLKMAMRSSTDESSKDEKEDNFAIGSYVIVRCRDAGVHAGVLVSKSGRSCVLKESRRLWYWKAKRGSFLSAVAKYGIDDNSKVGCEIDIELTENCEIILCSKDSEKSIRKQDSHNE